MKDKTIEVNVTGDTKELVIREGQALPAREPLLIDLSGDIDTVPRFIEQRFKNAGSDLQAVDPNVAVIIVDKKEMSMLLLLAPHHPYGGKVKGKMLFSDEMDLFQINGTKEYKQDELVKLIRFSRLHFDNEVQHGKVLEAFMKLNAQAIVELESQAKDNRGNQASNFKKEVVTSLPTEFILNIPIFKGQPKERFRVEIALDVTGAGARFWFESVELAEIIEKRKKEIFSAKLALLNEFVIINK